jgi:hypothetical protein
MSRTATSYMSIYFWDGFLVGLVPHATQGWVGVQLTKLWSSCVLVLVEYCDLQHLQIEPVEGTHYLWSHHMGCVIPSPLFCTDVEENNAIKYFPSCIMDCFYVTTSISFYCIAGHIQYLT